MPTKRVTEAVAVLLVVLLGAVQVSVTYLLPPPGQASAALPYVEITSGSWNDRYPSWSPDGKLIAYESDRGGVDGVWLLHMDTDSATRLTASGVTAGSPSWSPDSKMVAFWSQGKSGIDISLAYVANTSVVTLTTGEHDAAKAQPKWSPDGKSLLFMATSGGTSLVSVDVATRSTKVLTPVEGDYASADWVSTSVVVYSTLGQKGYELDLLNLTSGTTRTLFTAAANYTAPIVSLTASRLVYITNLIPLMYGERYYPCPYLPGDYNLWVSGLDGSNASFQSAPVGTYIPNSLTYPAPYTPGTIGPGQALAWSPDGKTIAYTAYSVLHGTGVYLWNISMWASTYGSLGPTNATSTDLTWSPDSATLAFTSDFGGYYHLYLLNTTGQVTPMIVGQIE